MNLSGLCNNGFSIKSQGERIIDNIRINKLIHKRFVERATERLLSKSEFTVLQPIGIITALISA
jgi:hypothetical protein